MEIYDIKGTAKLLMLSTRTIYSYLKSGKLKGAKIGKYWRITDQDIRDFLTDNAAPDKGKGVRKDIER